MINRKLKDCIGVQFETSLGWRALGVPIASVPDNEHVDFELEVEHVDHLQAIADVPCVFMEVNHCLVRSRQFLLDKPTM